MMTPELTVERKALEDEYNVNHAMRSCSVEFQKKVNKFVGKLIEAGCSADAPVVIRGSYGGKQQVWYKF